MRVQWQLAGVLALALVLCSVGCAVSRYQYISLEDVPGIEVETYGTPTLKNLYFSSRMPSRYHLAREHYRLSFYASLDSYLPEIRVAVKGNDGELLRLSQQASRRARSDRVVPCGSFGNVAKTQGELRFSWVTCAESGADERYISFDVTSENGLLVGSEDIPFELEANGFYAMPDLP